MKEPTPAVDEAVLLRRESRAKLVSALVRYLVEIEREEARQQRLRRVVR